VGQKRDEGQTQTHGSLSNASPNKVASRRGATMGNHRGTHEVLLPTEADDIWEPPQKKNNEDDDTPQRRRTLGGKP